MRVLGHVEGKPARMTHHVRGWRLLDTHWFVDRRRSAFFDEKVALLPGSKVKRKIDFDKILVYAGELRRDCLAIRDEVQRAGRVGRFDARPNGIPKAPQACGLRHLYTRDLC